MTVPRDDSVPGAMDAVYQGVMQFLHFRETTRTMDECLVKFDLKDGFVVKRGGANKKGRQLSG